MSERETALPPTCTVASHTGGARCSSPPATTTATATAPAATAAPAAEGAGLAFIPSTARRMSPRAGKGHRAASLRRRLSRGWLRAAQGVHETRWLPAPTASWWRRSPGERDRRTGLHWGVGRWTRRRARRYSTRSFALARQPGGHRAWRRPSLLGEIGGRHLFHVVGEQPAPLVYIEDGQGLADRLSLLLQHRGASGSTGTSGSTTFGFSRSRRCRRR